MRAIRYRSLLAACLAALLFAGCDPVEGIRVGDFEARVTGDVDTAFAGDAYWTVFESDGRSTFALLLFRDGLRASRRTEYAYIALTRAGAAPGVGVFTVANQEPNPPTFRGQYADVTAATTPAASGPVLGATGGVLTVTRFDAGLMTGSFRFNASGLRLPETGTFVLGTVSGTFQARYIAPGVITGRGIPFGLD